MKNIKMLWLLLIIVTFILNSCGGGGGTRVDNNGSLNINVSDINLSIEDINNTIEDEESNLSIEDMNSSVEEGNLSIEDINNSIEECNTTDINGTIIEDCNISDDINSSDNNDYIKDSNRQPEISGDIYIGDGTPKEANITVDDFDRANLTLEIEDDLTLTTANNFLFGLNINELDDETIERLKQFMTLGISVDYNQTGCVESNNPPFNVEDYKNAYITGVNEDNIDRVNLSIEALDLRDTRDIKVALRVIDGLGIRNSDIKIVETKPELIIDVNQSVVTSFKVDDFVNNGFNGIDENNIEDMNKFITYQLNIQTLEELKNVVERAYQYNISVDLQCENSDADDEHNLTLDGYNIACISTNNIDNLTSLAIDLNLSNTKEIRDIYTTAYAIGIELAPSILTAPPMISIIEDKENKIYMKKTGQTAIFEPKDDGYYQSGVKPFYERIDFGDDKGVVKDKLRGLMWQDSKDIAIKQWLTDEDYHGCEDIGLVGSNVNGIIITPDMACENKFKNLGDSAYNYCNDLNLGEYDDWRLPYIEELSDLTDYQAPRWSDNWEIENYSIPKEFKYTRFEAYWSQSFYRGFEWDHAWVWGSQDGTVIHTWTDYNGAVRCVREYKDIYFASAEDDYEDLGNNIIRDNLRGIEWEVSKSPYDKWDVLVKYCKDKTTDGGGWRLPNINELTTIVDRLRGTLAVKKPFLTYTTIAGYWSSTTAIVWQGMNDKAFRIETYRGSEIKAEKTNVNKGFCIRDIRNE